MLTIAASLADSRARALRYHTDQGKLASDLDLGESLRARVLRRLGKDVKAFAAATPSMQHMDEHLPATARRI